MEKETPVYRMIYYKIVNRILVGIYPKGYRLESVQKIRDRWDIGYTSIRRALHLLEQNGFIRLEERRRPVVIFDPEQPEGQALRRNVFLSRCSAHLDCSLAIPCLLPGLVELGARRCDVRLLAELDALLAQPEESFVRQCDLQALGYAWLTTVARSAGNELSDDLFLQIRGFDDLRMIVLPGERLVPGEAHAFLQYLRYWNELLRKGDLAGVRILVSIFCQQALCSLEHDLRALDDLPERHDLPQVQFRWFVRQMPTPLYRRVAVDLLRTVHLQDIRPGDLFPPESTLMDQYGVAAVTVRGALSLLNELGVARTLNGVGTLYTGQRAEGPEAERCRREGLEALDILAAVGPSLASGAAPMLSGTHNVYEGSAAFERREGLFIWLLRRFVQLLNIHALTEVFDRLEAQYLFALYTSGLPGTPALYALNGEVSRQVQDILALLEAGDSDGFYAGFTRLCRTLRDTLYPLMATGAKAAD